MEKEKRKVDKGKGKPVRAKAPKRKAAAAAAGAGPQTAHEPRAPISTRGLFTNTRFRVRVLAAGPGFATVKTIMYGAGDDEEPYQESIDLMEDIMVEYVTTLIQDSLDHASGKGGKPTVADLLFLIRKDPAKYGRAQSLLKLNEEIKQAKKVKAVEEDHL